MTDRLFTIEALVDSLRSCTEEQGTEYLLAFSGGLDSSVLLDAMHRASRAAELPDFSLTVVHVNHGLHRDADSWQRHCEQVCSSLNLHCISERLDSAPLAGDSIEAWAREARYRVLARHCDKKTVLLTAHHQDDQAETLLLNLLRGSGPHGLAGMPVLRMLNRAEGLIPLCRPLLGFSRESLQNYAQQQGLNWLDDPSNQEPAYDRNYLRLKVLPMLQQRWPACHRSLRHAAEIQADVVSLLDEFAARDLQGIVNASGLVCSIPDLLALSPVRQENLLRYWFRSQGLYPPGRRQMVSLRQQMLQAERDTQPQLKIGAVLLRRYRDQLHLELQPEKNISQDCVWQLSEPLALEGGILRATATLGQGIAADRIGATQVQVRFRQGGERCHPVGRQGSHPLKKIFQELDIPVWRRDQVPLIYVDDEIVAVADFFICEGYQAGAGESGWQIEWEQL